MAVHRPVHRSGDIVNGITVAAACVLRSDCTCSRVCTCVHYFLPQTARAVDSFEEPRGGGDSDLYTLVA